MARSPCRRRSWCHGRSNGGPVVGHKVHIEAANLAEAMAKARKENPGWTVMRDGSSRIG